MGKRVSISQPVVIQTELRPLDESFWIGNDSQLEQWYYQNTNVFAPDRQITNLTLTPMISAKDTDTQTEYSSYAQEQANLITFQTVTWKVKEWNGTQWVETTISSVSSADAYHLSGSSLVVCKNNYDATHAINITCQAQYRDPRDGGVLRYVEESVMLVTSVDATQVYPTIDILNPSARMYNPLKDESPIFEFDGTADWSGIDIQTQGDPAIVEYKADPLGTEEIIPDNEEMVLNAAPLLDIKYGDVVKTGQQFMSRQTADGEVETINGGVASVTNIKGDTVKLNQYINPSNIVTSSNEISNLSFNNGSFSYKFTTSSTSQHGTGIGIRNFAFIAGHKYYYSSRFDAAPDNLLNYYFRGIGTNVEVNLGTNKNIKGVYSCTSTQTASTAMIGLVVQGDSAAIDIKQSKYNLVDLTEMFGSGNEPSTAAAFEQWLSTHIGNLDYIPYTEGKLVNYGGFNVRWNQLIRNGNFANGTTEWDTIGTLSLSANNNEMTCVGGTHVTNNRIVQQNFTNITGHKYYISCDLWKDYHNNTNVVIGIGGYFNVSMNNVENIWVHTAGIVTTTNSYTGNVIEIYPRQTAGSGETLKIKNVIVIDLTLMFGADNEPDLDWCNKWLSKDYYPYCPSLDVNILDVMTEKVAGFNIWDEETRKGTYNSQTGAYDSSSNYLCCANPITVEASKTYYVKSPYILRICYYTSSGSFISSITAQNETFTTPANCAYLNFHANYSNDYLHDICINVSDASRNGTYEPYYQQYKSPEMGVKTVGFNLFDESTLILGKYRQPSGVEQTIADRRCSDVYFPCVPNTDYYLGYDGSIDIAYGVVICWYDANKNYISGTNRGSIPSYIHRSPSNAAYFRISSSSLSGNININISDTTKNGTYEPYWKSFTDTSWITKIGIENFNIWDEVMEEGTFEFITGEPVVDTTTLRSKNFIGVQSGETYYFKAIASAAAILYDANKNIVKSFTLSSNSTFTVSANGRFIKFRLLKSQYGNIYNHDICINKSIDHFNGRYYPYGMTAPYFPQGLCNVGSVYDEVYVDETTKKIKGKVRFGRVDLGDLTYTHNGNHVFRSPISNIKKSANTSSVANLITSPYQADTPSRVNSINKTIASDESVNNVAIRDESYSDAASFKAVMKGVPLIYELATPYEFEIDFPTKGQFEWYSVSNGTEVPIDTLPVYSQATQPSGYGQHTNRIRINAMYGESIPVILRVKRYPWSDGVLPPKVTKSVSWRIPPLDVIVTSDKGSAVRAQHIDEQDSSNDEEFTFSTIINEQGEIISDAKKEENMVFDWYYIKYGSTGAAQSPVSLGSGLTKAVSARTLKNTTPASGAAIPSTNVYCEAFVLGAYHLVNGQYVRTKEEEE